MQTLSLLLKFMAPLFGVIAALHLALGLDAEVLLGARISAETALDPSLNSQNRFYGVAFAVYGAILYISATDLPRYRPILLATLWVFFAAGLSRLVSWVVDGVPAPLVIGLAVIELVAPLLILFWIRTLRPAEH